MIDLSETFTTVAEETRRALFALRKVDLEAVVRRNSLGEDFNFESARKVLGEALDFFEQVPPERVDDLPESFQVTVRDQARWLYSLIERMKAFSPSKEDNPRIAHENLVNEANGSYINVFSQLHALIGFLTTFRRDFSVSEQKARAAVAAAEEETKRFQAYLAESRTQAEMALGEIRKVAAEQGVSQQASYFRDEADAHEALGEKWERYTVAVAIGLGVYALVCLIFSIFYVPASAYQAVQLAVSKLLIFVVIGYMLFHSARNYSAHRHNSVVNQHRKNALLTFNALVAAAGSEDKRDIVLTHAAACIFTPQDTGYTKATTPPQLSSSQLIEALPRLGHLGG